jgi:hypothetical protein
VASLEEKLKEFTDKLPCSGMEDPIANFAHEIGHAFGLMREHQRSELWSTHYGGGGMTNKFIFNCQNLADYEEKVAPLQENVQGLVCMQRGSALEAHFSAHEFLPILSPSIRGGSSGGNPDMDIQFIMMYPSNAGGIGAGVSRATVYTL